MVWELIDASFNTDPTTYYWNKKVPDLLNGQSVTDMTMTSENFGLGPIGSRVEEGSYDDLWDGPSPASGVNPSDCASFELTNSVEPGSLAHRNLFDVNPNSLVFPKKGHKASPQGSRVYSGVKIDASVVVN
jgi:hypothetical protein